MAKLPDSTSLGEVSSPLSGRPIATLDNGGYARAAAAIGSGVSDFGKGLKSATDDLAAVARAEKYETDTLDLAKANGYLAVQRKTLLDEASRETDMKALQGYAPKFQDNVSEAAKFISDPRKQQLWLTQQQPTMTGDRIAIDSRIRDVNKDTQVASVNTQLDTLATLASHTNDPDMVSKGAAYIDGLQKAGYINDKRATEMRQGWAVTVAASNLRRMAPEDRLRHLQEPDIKDNQADILPDQVRTKLVTEARGQMADMTRQRQLEATQAKAASDDEERRVFGAIYKNDPKFSIVADVIDNPKLTREAAERVTKYYDGRNPEQDRPEKLYGRDFYSFYERVHADAGNPNRITDPTVLYKQVGKDGGLTPAGVDKLITEIKGKSTPEGEASGKMEASFFQAARGQITYTNDLIRQRDPKGDQRFAEFQVYALKQIADAKAKGLSAYEIFDPKSASYIGKDVGRFKRTYAEAMADLSVDNDDDVATAPTAKGSGGITPATDPETLTSAAQLQEWYRAGGDRARAKAVAVKKGWAR